MNYQQSIDYLFSQLPMFHRIGAAAYKNSLDTTIQLAYSLGNPERKFRSIHIGGTNGKGSTAHFIASILQEQGYKTGLFTSPHLKDFRERIRINGKPIRKSRVCRFLEENKLSIERLRPSFFEMTFGLASQYFAEELVDFGVLEVGMGGRLDSTNIVRPVLSIITNIGFDHMAFLGDTPGQIAAEKAGIIKNGIPLVIGETQAEIKDIFVSIAGERQAPVSFADQIFTLLPLSPAYPIQAWRLEVYKEGKLWEGSLECPLSGQYQLKNLACVLQVTSELQRLGIEVGKENVIRGISRVLHNTHLRGRWEVLRKRPLVICDTGHNDDGLKEVSAQMRSLGKKQIHFVFGMVNDKDTDKIISLLPKEALYYFCKANIPRGLDVQVLAQCARKHALPGNTYPSVGEAFKAALSAAGPDDLVFVGGSTFTVAEVL